MTQVEQITLLDGSELPCYRCHTVVVGSGAAGLNAAGQLRELLPADCEVAVVTAALKGGTSYCSGSDKQTYWRLGAVDVFADNPRAMAETLAAGGCMHGDLALAEAEGSSRAFYNLVRSGVPFPQTPLGTFAGYRTDHDPLPRATSAGPWTSRFMVSCLLEHVRALGIPIFGSHEAVEIVTTEGEQGLQCAGLVVVDHTRVDDDNFGLMVFAAQNVIMATGGPGELYARTVYPQGQMGAHGVCFEAGLVGVNLTESQFGLASIEPRWNLSGSYQQVLPRYFSTDAQGGDERDFLAEVFPDPAERMRAIFLKGYQWPFSPQRAAPPGSSAIDLLVERENRQGRRVWIDFRTNPVPDFDVAALPEEARDYLVQSQATDTTPFERLRQMNPDAVELYESFRVNLAEEPLEIGVAAQHNNGGFYVNTWWESSLPHLFVVGEQAGTHGVTRPGGAALNSGQVGGLRAAQHIAHVCSENDPLADASLAETAAQIKERLQALVQRSATARISVTQAQQQIQRRLIDVAGPLRPAADIAGACAEAGRLWQQLREEGMQVSNPSEALAGLAVERMALAGWGYLEALAAYISRGGGSRGSYLILDPAYPPLDDAFPELSPRPEATELRDEIIEIWFNGERWLTRAMPVRPIPGQETWFEQVWRQFRGGQIWN